MLTPLTRCLLIIGFTCFSAPGYSAPPTAPMMPLADQSLLLDLATAGQRLLAAGERGHILYSDDNGKTWTQAQVPTTQMLTAVHFHDADTGWAVGHDGIVLASSDGGENWIVQRDGLAAQRQRSIKKREQARAEIQRLEAMIARENIDNASDESANDALEIALEDARYDLEDAEIALAEPTFASPLMDVWFADADNGWAVGAFGTMIATSDGGTTWVDRAHALDNEDEFHLNAIVGDTSGRVLIAGEGGVLFRSLDKGASWESLPTIYDGSYFGALYDAHSQALLTFGLRGNLFRSTDFGNSWNAVNADNTLTLAGGTATGNGQLVIAGSVGLILHSSDGGQSFSKATIEDRLSLSSGIRRGNTLVMVGQGGVKQVEVAP